LKHAERWLLCGAIGVAALVFVVVLTTRDEAPPKDAIKSVAAPHEIETVAQPSPTTSSNTAQLAERAPNSEHAAAPAAKAPREPSKTHGTIALRLRTGYEPRPDWPVRLTASVVGGGDEQRSTLQASLAQKIIYFDGVWPGDVLLRVDCDGCAPKETHVPIKIGFTQIVDLELDCRPPPGWVDVTLRSQSGKFDEQIDVWAGDFDPVGSVAWSDDGATRAGRFFCDLSSRGDTELTFMSWRSKFGLAPSNRVLARPGQVIELVVQDLAPSVAIGFRVVDAQTGDVLDDFEAHWSLAPLQTSRGHVKSGEIVLDDVPEGGALWWQISKPAYACVEGYLQQSSLIADGNQRLIQVELRRGRLLVVVVHNCDAGVIANVPVLADGLEIGRTNALGRFETTLDAVPASVEVRRPGWSRCPNHEPALVKFDTLDPCRRLDFYLMRN
jgi:hypothetical protein